MVTARYPAATRDLAIGHRNAAWKSSASGSARITEFPEARWYFTRQKQKQTETEAEETMCAIFSLTPRFSGVTERAPNSGTALAVSQLSTLNYQPSTKLWLNQFD